MHTRLHSKLIRVLVSCEVQIAGPKPPRPLAQRLVGISPQPDIGSWHLAGEVILFWCLKHETEMAGLTRELMGCRPLSRVWKGRDVTSHGLGQKRGKKRSVGTLGVVCSE